MRNPQAELAALNIALHPHDANGTRYVELMRAAFALNQAIRVHGSTWAMIGSLFEIIDGSPEEGLQGDIFRFVQINMKSEWLDLETMKPVSPEVAQREIVIPERLKPNVQRSRFVFFPKEHRLIFVSYFKGVSFSPNLAHRFFETLLTDIRLHQEFPSVEVTIEQSKEKLNAILNSPKLQFLRIVVKRPNPDGPDDDDAKLEAVLDAQNAREQVVELKNQKGKFLEPNKTNKNLAKLAMSNGYVEGEVVNDAGKKELKETIKHPSTKRLVFPQLNPFSVWFLEHARDFLDKLTSR